MNTTIARRIGALVAGLAAALTVASSAATVSGRPVGAQTMKTATSRRPSLRIAALAALGAVTLAACTQAEATPEALTVTGVDYGFDGVPDTLEVGTELTFRNASDVEAHEMVVFRIAGDEERPVTELLQLPDEEGQQAVEFVGVSMAMPGAEGSPMDGGPIVLDEPGRYALVCFLPTGADPEAVAAAMETGPDEEPDLGDGPPHFVGGMVTEFTVTE